MKLRTKIMMISLLPVFILGIGIFILAADRTANGIYDEAYAGMEAAALAVRDIFEVGNHGSYYEDEEGNLWKGDTLNISQSFEIADNIKDTTGMDVTIFWGDTRILTSIKDASGQRQVHTKASENVVKKVLQNGEHYLDRNVDILGTEYVVCYAPFYQDGTNEPVGMIFVGKPRSGVSKIINEIRLQMLAAIAAVLFVTGIVVVMLVNRITKALGKSMSLLQQIADGNLAVEIDSGLLKRSDEIGMLGNEILQLRNKLQTIVDILREKSSRLDLASLSLKERSDTILHLMIGLDQSAQEMSSSCTNQASDASTAGSGVTQMGEMIGASNTEIRKMHSISNQIQDMSEQTMSEIQELNADMKNVRTSIDYLGRQTALTKESADKISSATDLIAAVASQTSLLSLNASIEAARAGEFGRGFGVVASEIQNLSVQANEAVDDIRKMIESLTENTYHTIRRMEEVQTVIKSQEKNIEKTGQVFKNVRNSILDSVDHMNMIITQTENMEDVRTDMVAAVQNSAAMAQENAASVEQMMASLSSAYDEIRILSDKTEELGKLSLQMKDSVGVFSVQNA